MNIINDIEDVADLSEDAMDINGLLPHPEFRQAIGDLKFKMERLEKRVAELEKK